MVAVYRFNNRFNGKRIEMLKDIIIWIQKNIFMGNSWLNRIQTHSLVHKNEIIVFIYFSLSHCRWLRISIKIVSKKQSLDWVYLFEVERQTLNIEPRLNTTRSIELVKLPAKNKHVFDAKNRLANKLFRSRYKISSTNKLNVLENVSIGELKLLYADTHIYTNIFIFI